MTSYCFNDNTDSRGNHEVHKYSCDWLPSDRNRTYLGEFTYDFQAMIHARAKYPSKKFDGCFFCMPTEHTS